MYNLSHSPPRPRYLAPAIVGIVALGFVLILLGSTPFQILGAVILTATLAIPFLYDQWGKQEPMAPEGVGEANDPVAPGYPQSILESTPGSAGHRSQRADGANGSATSSVIHRRRRAE
jgi:hypothetical protein